MYTTSTSTNVSITAMSHKPIPTPVGNIGMFNRSQIGGRLPPVKPTGKSPIFQSIVNDIHIFLIHIIK